MLGSLAKKWGFGVEFVFDAAGSLSVMSSVRQSLASVQSGVDKLKAGGGQVLGGLTGVAALTAPLAGGLALAAYHGSQLSATLEAQALTMGVLLDSTDKAKDLMAQIADFAASTPFERGDLIEGSKRLLDLSGKNVQKNMDLLHLSATLAALNPGHSVVDAVEALKDAASGGGFERLKELNISGLSADQFKKAGIAGGAKWADAVLKTVTARIQEKTGGKDLIGMLSKTQVGISSNLQDAVDALLLGFGDAIAPMKNAVILALTDAFNQAAPIARKAATEAAEALAAAWAERVEPWRLKLVAWWESLGEAGQTTVIRWAMGLAVLGVAIGALAGFGAAALGVLGLVGTAIGGVLTIAGGLFEIVTGGGLLVIPVLAAIAVGAVALAAGLALLGIQGSGAWLVLQVAALEVWGVLQGFYTAASAFVLAFGNEWYLTWSPIGDMIAAEIRPAVLELWSAVLLLVGAFGLGGATGYDFANMGVLIASVWSDLVFPGIMLGVFGLERMLEIATAVINVFAVAITFARSLAVALFGLADGSLTFGEAFELMSLRLLEVVVTLIRRTMVFALQAVSRLFGIIAPVLLLLPGFGLLGAAVDASGKGAGLLAGAVDPELKAAAASIHVQGDQIENTRRQRANEAHTVRIDPTTKEPVIVFLENKLWLDSQQVAKSTAKTEVNAGEAGKKPRMPPDQRGRVLRNGLEITPLQAGEVL